MNPEYWGPSAWKFIHSVALSYPEKPTTNDIENYKNFFISIGNVLPCERCQKHYKKNVSIDNLNIALKSNKELFKWTVELHNKVNKFNNKKQFTVQEALQAMDTEEDFFDYKIIIIIILLFLYITK